MKDKILLEEWDALSLKEAIAEGRIRRAIFGIGACENHGRHLPMGTDRMFPTKVGEEVAKALGDTVVVPTVPYGMSMHYSSIGPCLTLSYDTEVALLREVLESIVNMGILHIFMMNGHDGNIPAIEMAARQVKHKYPDVHIGVLYSWWNLSNTPVAGQFEVWNGLGHAGEGETSAMLASRPDLVDVSVAKGRVPEFPYENQGFIQTIWEFGELTEYGATGDPSKATPEKGQSILGYVVQEIVKYFTDLDRAGGKYGLKLNN
ncbi:MAG: creatininase family protein [Cohnella sp.]|jgi:creatinine amidohydrolase|nr:creatininase family protein [Cohnella sp.]